MKGKENQDRKTARGITWDDVEILVIGAGTMGASLAQVYAQSGFNVGMVDVSNEMLERALQTIDGELKAGEKAGIFTPPQVEEIKGRILATTSCERACRGKKLDLVIETATEDIEIKKEIFRKLDEL
ncbi:MAG: 3-hydroxyacyl-CoA dehydrogenase NAD-binding domain-containing protein, partial [Candidatus Aminicenantes bacterium]|nr:3-hydroxyacyl-CoA dehydrogenase NAD-binding domain-containing protein [Candidatus Aminicenantes bacterium]